MSRSVLVVFFLLLSPGVVWAASSDVTVSVFYAECTDGVDNDGDGLIDYPDDPDCTEAGDDNETYIAPMECADGIDNDSDDLTDYPDDPGCESVADDNETDNRGASSNAGRGRSGGSSSSNPTPIQVTISGTSDVPGEVVILENGIEQARIQAEKGADFSQTLTNLTPGAHNFSVYIVTDEGDRVLLDSYPVVVSDSGTYTTAEDTRAVSTNNTRGDNSDGRGNNNESNVITTVGETSASKMLVQKTEDESPKVVISGFTEPFAKVTAYVRPKHNQFSNLINSMTASVFSIFGLAETNDGSEMVMQTTANENGYYEFVVDEQNLDTGEYVASVQIEGVSGTEEHMADFSVNPVDIAEDSYKNRKDSSNIQIVTTFIIFFIIILWLVARNKLQSN